MSDVSPLVPRSLIIFLTEPGSARDQLLAEIQNADPVDPFLSEEYLMRGSKRMPWNSFCSFGAAVDSRFTDELAIEYTIKSYQPQQSWFVLKALCRLIASPYFLYHVGNLFVGPRIFGKGIIASIERKPDGTFLQKLSLSPGMRDSRFFFHMSQFGLALQPITVGLPRSVVRAKISPREATYEIVPPPSFTFVARVHRAWRSLFSSRAMWLEHSHQEERLRVSFAELSASESALRTAHERLEERVSERTRELTRANKVLEEQLKQIIQQEQENKILNERLLNLQKLESLGTLAGGIAHEINNVLHGIFLSIDLADRRIEPNHPSKEKVKAVTRFAIRGQELTRQILAFSRKNQIEHRAVDVREVIEKSVALIKLNCLSPIEFKFEVESPYIWGDDLQLQQILVNLLHNAKDASASEASAIEVVVSNLEGGSLAISVVDSGDGIPEKIRSRLFDPFFTTKPVGKGSGMGLAVAHGLAQSLKGRIHYESRERGGSVFKIVLPAIQTPAKHADFAFDENHGGNESLLIVDDELELLGLLKDTLGLFGYRVHTASSGEDALKIFDSHAIDLVLTDHIMPKMNGTELARNIKLRSPKTPILMCTGYSEHSIDHDSRVVEAFVSKPIDAVSLNDSIRTHLDRR